MPTGFLLTKLALSSRERKTTMAVTCLHLLHTLLWRRNVQVLQEIIIVPTWRTAKEHNLLVCRNRRTGRIYGALARGTRKKASAIQCEIQDEAIVFVHTHPTQDEPTLSRGDVTWSDYYNIPICALGNSLRWFRTECYSPFTGRICRGQTKIGYRAPTMEEEQAFIRSRR